MVTLTTVRFVRGRTCLRVRLCAVSEYRRSPVRGMPVGHNCLVRAIALRRYGSMRTTFLKWACAGSPASDEPDKTHVPLNPWCVCLVRKFARLKKNFYIWSARYHNVNCVNPQMKSRSYTIYTTL